jgi:type I restriction enzyme M protein
VAADDESVLERVLQDTVLKEALLKHAEFGIGRSQALEIAVGLLDLRRGMDESDWRRFDESGVFDFADIARRSVEELIGGHYDPRLRAQLKAFGRFENQWLRRLIEALGSVTTTAGAVAAFETIVDTLGASGTGDHATPASIVRLAVRMLAPVHDSRVYDPHARTGEFLVAAAESIARTDGQADRIQGLVPSVHDAWLASMNLRLHGVTASVEPARPLTPAHDDRRFDADHVFANPPFNQPAAEDVDGRWNGRYGRPPKNNANYAWLLHVEDVLTREGNAAILMPAAAASSHNGAEQALRAAMVEDGIVAAMVALPPRLFLSTAIPVDLWLLSRLTQSAAAAGEHRGVLFIDAREVGAMASRTQRVLRDEDIAAIGDTYRRWHDEGAAVEEPGFAHSAAIDEIRSREHDLSPGRYVGTVAPRSAETEDPVSLTDLADDVERLQAVADDAAQRMRAQLERLHG